MILWMMRIVAIDIDLHQYIAHWDWLPTQWLLALGPLFYLYVLKLTDPAHKFRSKDLLYFTPVLLELLALVLEIIEGHRTGQPTYQTNLFHQLNPVLQLLIVVSNLIYLRLCDRRIKTYDTRLQPSLMDRSLLEYRWLRRLLKASTFLWIGWLVCAVLDLTLYHGEPGPPVHYSFYIFFMVMLIWTAAAALLQPQQSPGLLSDGTSPPVPLHLKAKASWLKQQMEARRYFEDPDLSLPKLAGKVGMTPHELSRLINTAVKKSFNDFINEYRVVDAARKIADPAYENMTLLGIGFEAGFNSKTSFNRIFKEMTGKSPTEYKKQVEKERPTYNSRRKVLSRLLILNREPVLQPVPVNLNSYRMYRNYWKTAFRNLLRYKTYSLINIAGLSIGLACSILIMLYVQDELSYDRFHHHAGQIYRIDKQNTRDDGRVSTGSYTGYFPGPRFSAKIPEIKSFVRFQPSRVDIKNRDMVESQPVDLVDTNFLSVFNFPLLRGNPNALAEPNAVVITEDVSRKYFGNTNAVGQTLLIKEDSVFTSYIVTAIAKNCPQNSSIKFQVLLPLKVSAITESDNGNWFNSFLSTFVVLAPGADVKAVEAKMASVFESDASKAISEIKSKYGVKSIGISYLLEPLTAIHLGEFVPAENEILQDKSNPAFSYILSAIAVLILVIACVNFVNLTVARSVKRAKEIGIRKVIGGSTAQLRVQFLSESFVLCLIAFLLAVVIVMLVLPVFSQLSNKALSLSYLFNGRMIPGYLLLFVVTSLLAGFYPSIVLSNYNPVQTLYSRFNLAGKNYLQKGLVVFQFALASFLIIGSITIYLQFNYLTSQSLGYDDDHLITINKPGLSRSEAALFKRELLKSPDIIDAAVKNSSDNNNTVKVNGEQAINVAVETIDESFLPLLKVPLSAGRNFSANYPGDATAAVLVNEAFVKEAGWKDPVGQRVTTFEKGETYTVAGVVKDYHYKPLTEKIGAQLFTMNPANAYGTVFIRIKPGSEASSLRYIAGVFRDLFPLNAFGYQFKKEENEQLYASEARWKQILLFSAILTVFISCIGLFGLSVLAAEKRVKEIGVRKVLGASVGQIVQILSVDFLRLIFIALAVSIPLAWMATSKWLQYYPYRISLSWGLFVSGALLVIGVAMFTISFQSVKAAMGNPVRSLRRE
ncbi:MAG: antibiotic ABC transporter permease [Citrobacter freundii]|nr:MAG: antibiotic ABC transporter permease [Citrobacter freundii]